MTTSSKQISSLDIVREVRKLAAEMPDFVYTKENPSADNCSNTRGGCSKYPDHKGCIVGQAIRRCGLDIHQSLDEASAYALILPLEINDVCTASRWLRRAQRHQDCGNSWENAVYEADRAFPEIVKLLADAEVTSEDN